MRLAGSRSRTALVVALAVQVVVIAWLVLNPNPAVPTSAVYRISRWLVNGHVGSWSTVPRIVELVLNVALFVPTGMTLALLVPRVPWWGWTALGFLGSGAIELTQLLLLSARAASWHDVLANTLGVGLGALLVAAVRRMLVVRGASR